MSARRVLQVLRYHHLPPLRHTNRLFIEFPGILFLSVSMLSCYRGCEYAGDRGSHLTCQECRDDLS